MFSLFDDSLFKSISHSNERINKVTGNTKTVGSLTSGAWRFIRFSYLYLDLNSDFVGIFVNRITIQISVRFYELIMYTLQVINVTEILDFLPQCRVIFIIFIS